MQACKGGGSSFYEEAFKQRGNIIITASGRGASKYEHVVVGSSLHGASITLYTPS